MCVCVCVCVCVGGGGGREGGGREGLGDGGKKWWVGGGGGGGRSILGKVEDRNQTSHFILSFPLLPTATFSPLIETISHFAHFSKKSRSHKPSSLIFFHTSPSSVLSLFPEDENECARSEAGQ